MVQKYHTGYLSEYDKQKNLYFVGDQQNTNFILTFNSNFKLDESCLEVKEVPLIWKKEAKNVKIIEFYELFTKVKKGTPKLISKKRIFSKAKRIRKEKQEIKVRFLKKKDYLKHIFKTKTKKAENKSYF